MAKSVFAFTWPKVFAFRVVCKWPLEVAYHLCGTINCRDHFTLFLQGENKFYSSFSVGLTIGSRNSISSSLPSGGHGGGAGGGNSCFSSGDDMGWAAPAYTCTAEHAKALRMIIQGHKNLSTVECHRD